MNNYYCPNCGATYRRAHPISSSSFNDTPYKAGKLAWHTSSSVVSPKTVSRFDPPYWGSTDSLIRASESSWLELEPGGACNYLFPSGSIIGTKYVPGASGTPCDTVKVIYPDNDQKVHAYLEESDRYPGIHCAECGRAWP
jgi:hypothetical protein